jgi:hypothetical protein
MVLGVVALKVCGYSVFDGLKSRLIKNKCFLAGSFDVQKLMKSFIQL